MNTNKLIIAISFFLCSHVYVLAQSPSGLWNAEIECPGGAIRFGLELTNESGDWKGFLVNGPEKIEIPSVKIKEDTVSISIDHYDSRLELNRESDSKLSGVWKKRRGKNKRLEMKVTATRATAPNNNTIKSLFADKILGRWQVKFESSEDPAVGVFTANKDRVDGNFMTTTGDYRYLDGTVEDRVLELSCFDGAHAFLFRSRLEEDGTLKGDFWSSNTWHETFTATKNANAKLPDDFKRTSVKDSDLSGLRFPDLEGNPTSLDDPKFSGKARIIYVFGSWCPNCHDAADYFAELETRYSGKGLSILGLAFELTGEFERDAEQVRKYLKRHGSNYPVLVAGLSDKAKASKALPLLDRIRSYPTTIFLDRKNQVVAIHTGFTGPATGETYQELKKKFESLIEGLLKDENE